MAAERSVRREMDDTNDPRARTSWSRRSGAGAALAALGLLLLGGCRGEQVTHYRIAREAPDPGAPTPLDPPAGDPERGAPGVRLGWALPPGWTSTPEAGMRYATLRPPVAGAVDGSVVVLPGPAGGELANVNRWRGQIDLPPEDEAGLAAARRTLRAPAGPVRLYDFTSARGRRRRLVAGILVAGGSSWFVKLTGDEAPVAAARADFVHLLESLHLD